MAYTLTQFGWLVSWVYLRFYQRGASGLRGDPSEMFAFVHWFPPFLHTPVSRLSRAVFRTASWLHVIPRAPDGSADLELHIEAEEPATRRAEAERRRAMALAALDERVAQMPESS